MFSKAFSTFIIIMTFVSRINVTHRFLSIKAFTPFLSSHLKLVEHNRWQQKKIISWRIFCVRLFYAFSGCLLRTMYAFKNIEFRFQLKQIYVRKYKGVFSIYHQKITEVFGNLFIIQLVSTQYVYELVFIFCVFLFHQYSWIFYTSSHFGENWS